jgi:hypothetical protein
MSSRINHEAELMQQCVAYAATVRYCMSCPTAWRRSGCSMWHDGRPYCKAGRKLLSPRESLPITVLKSHSGRFCKILCTYVPGKMEDGGGS